MSSRIIDVSPPKPEPFHLIRNGSLALRSLRTPWAHTPARYSRAVMNSGWSEARESEPKDYDLNKTPRRLELRSTYNRIATVTDGSLPISTYQALGKDSELKKYYTARRYRKPVVSQESYYSSVLDRETGLPKTGYAAALPQIPPMFFEYMTTNVDHFRRPYKPLPVAEVIEPEFDSRPNRHMISQFTDVGNHRRVGRNHWLDESGHYFNTHLKAVSPHYMRRPPPFRTNFDRANFDRRMKVTTKIK